MTTQQILLSALIFGAMNNITFAMDNNATNNNYSEEEKIFHTNVSKLNYHAARFVLHFKDWSKEEQDKITTYNSDVYHGYVVSRKLKASQLFGGNVVRYLDNQVPKNELIPFLEAMEYLKKQK